MEQLDRLQLEPNQEKEADLDKSPPPPRETSHVVFTPVEKLEEGDADVADSNAEEIVDDKIEEIAKTETPVVDKGQDESDVFAALDELDDGGNSNDEAEKTMDEEDGEKANTEVVEEEEEVDPEISFTVKTPSGQQYNLHMKLSSTIADCRHHLSKMRGQSLEADEIKLIFRGKPRNDSDMTLAELGLKDGNVMHMVRSLNALSDASPAGAIIQTTPEEDRGFLTLRLPANATAGTRMVITPPGGRQLVFYVPQGTGPGQLLRVELPRDDVPTPTAAAPTGSASGGNETAVAPPKATDVFSIKCPADVVPGAEVEVSVPGLGRVKVPIPGGIRAGMPIYFRPIPIGAPPTRQA